MITYVNTVFVNNDNTVTINETSAIKDYTKAEGAEKVKGFVIDKKDDNIRIGLFQGKSMHIAGKGDAYRPVIKWSNWINKNYIKSAHYMLADAYKANTKLAEEDTVTINFTNCFKKTVNESPVEIDPNEFAQGNRRIVVRLTFKDMPTRFRKWTESYEYVTKPGDKAKEISEAFAAMINNQYKRARVDAVAANGVLTLTAMPYDDDNSVDTINVANKVRFTANVYYTNPQAAGFASKNKYFPIGLTISKKEGYDDPMSAKHVRDREAQAMGYEGILNRDCCTSPVIKPAMITDLSKKYNGITIEFENMYRAADDIQRHTKQNIEIYTVGDPTTATTGLIAKLEKALGITIEKVEYKETAE